MTNFPKNFLLHLILVGMLITVSAGAVAPQEYGFLYWEYGWRGKSPNDERVLSVLTSHYGASFDVEKAALIGLGGYPVDKPYASFYGTNNGIPSMNVELSPPPTLAQLEPGDFVEAFVELVVVPMYADEYYGPNQEFLEHLKEHENSWQPVHQLAVHNE